MFGSMFRKASKAAPDSQGKHHGGESANISPDKPWHSHPPPPPVLSGVPAFSLVLAVDHVQGLVAVGNELGEVHLWGEANAEQRLPSPSTDGPSPVREIHFLVNEGRMLVMHAPSLMCLWSLHGKSAALVATATVPSTLAMGLHVPRSPYFLFGTERNAIVLAFRVADDKIKPATWSRSFVNAAFINGMPMVGKVMALALRPADPSLSLLVGVHHGALLVAKLAEPDSKPVVLGVHPDARVGLTAAVWLDASGLLAAGYDNGDALVWSLRNPSAPTARIQLSDFGPTGLPTAAVARGPSGVPPPPPPRPPPPPPPPPPSPPSRAATAVDDDDDDDLGIPNFVGIVEGGEDGGDDDDDLGIPNFLGMVDAPDAADDDDDLGIPNFVGLVETPAAAASVDGAVAEDMTDVDVHFAPRERRPVRALRVLSSSDGPVLYALGGTCISQQPDGLVVCRGAGFKERSLLVPPSGGVLASVPSGFRAAKYAGGVPLETPTAESLYVLVSDGSLLRYSLRRMGSAPARFPLEACLPSEAAGTPIVRLALTPCGAQRTLATLSVSRPLASPPATVLPPLPALEDEPTGGSAGPRDPFFERGRPWPPDPSESTMLSGLAGKAASWLQAPEGGAAEPSRFGSMLSSGLQWVAKKQEEARVEPAVLLGRILFPEPSAPPPPPPPPPPAGASAAGVSAAGRPPPPPGGVRGRGSAEDEQARRDRVYEEAKRDALLGRKSVVLSGAGAGSSGAPGHAVAGKARAAPAGKLRRATADAADASSMMQQNVHALHERGEKLGELGDKSQKLSDDAENFLSLAKELRKQNERPFFGLF